MGDDCGDLLPANPELMAETLQPRPTERPDDPCPALGPPRSAKRAYSHAELCLAADLLAKLRRRDDQRTLADRAVALQDATHALDVAVDRLLDVL